MSVEAADGKVALGAPENAEVVYRPVKGGPPRQLTRFPGSEKTVFSFEWSPDSTRLICARGSIVLDMLLIREQ